MLIIRFDGQKGNIEVSGSSKGLVPDKKVIKAD
jgi:hypothetical protein